MKIKKGLKDVFTSDVFSDLLEEVLNPYDICANKKDADEVKKAVDTLRDFMESCENSIEDFYT
jgi:hypothetical protein